jgi:DNA helicase-2/ATP-dependent DNA helicase PcrA
MPRPPLTNEQRTAVIARSPRIFIEANPGSGKTTVAAERFGLIRFEQRSGASQATTAVSFTRSATSELHKRIKGRWGSGALSWPHGVTTIDTLVFTIVQHLLRTGRIHWPGGHTALEVLDDWRGHQGFRWLPAGSYRRVCALDANRTVTSVGVLVQEARPGFGNRGTFEQHLATGRCTHEDVRAVLSSALRIIDLRNLVSAYIASSIHHLIVDEVFDANRLDLFIVALACNTRINVTLVGDPWQALYGFRGANPELVPGLIRDGHFQTLPLTHSFRFRTPQMRALAESLRGRAPIILAAGGPYDVVLASNWDTLWNGPDNVLPLSFGRTTNRTDAAAIVLLDHIVHAKFAQRTIFLPEALLLLDLDPEAYRMQGPTVLGNVVDTLVRPGGGPAAALRALRQAVIQLGGARRPRAGGADAEQRQLDRLDALARRVRAGYVVPGMTIHQAKGREWNHVGVRLTDGEVGILGRGLDPTAESNRALYVALTRARYAATLIN